MDTHKTLIAALMSGALIAGTAAPALAGGPVKDAMPIDQVLQKLSEAGYTDVRSIEATWNAICLADFGDGGVAFVAQPQIPPRNLNWSSEGKWVHLAKIGFEKYFLHKIRPVPRPGIWPQSNLCKSFSE